MKDRMVGREDLADCIIADNAGDFYTPEEFDELSECPVCGSELMLGSAKFRMEDTSELNMNVDIDSGNKMEGEIRAKSCQSDPFQVVRVQISSYAGY